MDADGTDVARVTNNPAQDFDPAFSADGSRIAFASDRVGGIGRIHVMRADGSAPTLLTSSDTSSDEDPSFSPDGTKVAFAADFVCPPGYGCGQIVGGSIVVTGSDGLSARTGVSYAPWAELDWGVAYPGSPSDPGPDPTPGPAPDTTAPETRFVSGPAGPTNDSTPSFSFTGTDDVTATGQLRYSTRLDQGAWSSYLPDTTVTLAVADGPHTIPVRARDEAGNEDPTPAQRSFTVDTVAPTGTVTLQDGAQRRAPPPAPAPTAPRTGRRRSRGGRSLRLASAAHTTPVGRPARTRRARAGPPQPDGPAKPRLERPRAAHKANHSSAQTTHDAAISTTTASTTVTSTSVASTRVATATAVYAAGLTSIPRRSHGTGFAGRSASSAWSSP